MAPLYFQVLKKCFMKPKKMPLANISDQKIVCLYTCKAISYPFGYKFKLFLSMHSCSVAVAGLWIPIFWP